MIALTDLQEMFDNIRANAGWDTSQPLLWGYFFFDPSGEKLSDAAGLLEEQGYRAVGIFESETRTEDGPMLVLHVEREETHTPESLYALNARLGAFAAEHGIASYDGMDVGPLGSEPV